MKKIYLTILYGKGKKAKGYLLDLSEGGVAVASSAKIKVNTTVEIITAKNYLPLSKGRVAYVVKRPNKNYGYCMGIEFTFKDEKLVKRVSALLLSFEKRKCRRVIL